MIGDQNGKRSQSLDSDSLFPSEMHEEDTALEPVQQDPWCRAGKFSEEGAPLEPQVDPWTNKLPRFSHLVYEPDLKLSYWTTEETGNWMRLNPAGSVAWSMETSRFSPQGEGQHAAGMAAAAFGRPLGPPNPQPLVLSNLPRDFFNFHLEEEEEEEEDEEEQDNSASPTKKTPWIGYPRGWDPGLFNAWHGPPPDMSPELLPLSPSLTQGSEAPAQPSSSFRPPVFRACRRRLCF